MPEKQEYANVTQQGDGGFSDRGPSQSMANGQEAQAELSGDAPNAEGPPPPSYNSLANAVEENVHSLLIGDPDESILVPMIHTSQKQTFKTMFLGKAPKTSYTVVARKMPRSHYLQFYARDSQGNYVGTKKEAADASLVFVPSKSTPEDLLQQVRKVAFGKQHYGSDFGSSGGMSGGGGAF